MTRFEVTIANQTYQVELELTDDSGNSREAAHNLDGQIWRVKLDRQEIAVDWRRVGANTLSFLVNGQSFQARLNRSGEALTVFLQGKSFECTVRDPRSLSSRKRAAGSETGEQKIATSMPGKVVRILVRPGDSINAGQGILVIEAMKMQNEVRAPRSGTLKSIVIKEGATVNAGEMLAIIE